jgi:endonuclease-3
MPAPRGARARAVEVARLLTIEYPEVRCALDHRNAFELLAATILSAQCTDERVNMVTPALFAAFPTPDDLAVAPPERVEELVQSTGFFRSKAKSLIGMAQALVDRFEGEVPTDLDDLVTIPGVGRKTGNVVRSVAFGLPGLPVDTHVTRLSGLLGLTKETDAVKIEMALDPMVPPDERGAFSLRLIEHGRRVCIARRPQCADCILADICPSAGKLGAGSAKKAGAKKVAAKNTGAETTGAKKATGAPAKRAGKGRS